MESIDISSLLSKLLEIDHPSDDEDSFQIEEEEEEESQELTDDDSDYSNEELDLKAIASEKFDQVIFDKYEKITTKCKKKFTDISNYSSHYIFSYCQKHLSGNISLLFFIIIENLEENKKAIIQICEVVRYLDYNLNHDEIISNFCKAAYTYREKYNKYDEIHIIFFQLLYSINILSFNESSKILQILIGPNQIINPDKIFQEKLSFPRKETAKINRRNTLFYKQLISFNKILEDMHLLSEPNEKIPYKTNDFMDELIKQYKIQKNNRRYSSKFLAISTIAYLYGSKSYSFLRKFLPIPHETTLRKWFSPDIQVFIECLTNINNVDKIINEFIPMNKNNIQATLAIDAAKFKNISGETIKKIFPLIDNIQKDKIYSNIFIYYLQPINNSIKPFPIFVKLSESGAANDEIIQITDRIFSILDRFNVSISFIATDGDHKFDFLHDKFLKLSFIVLN